MKRVLQHLPEISLGTVALLLMVLFVPALSARMTAGAQERACRDNLKAIYQAIQRYQAEHKGAYPPSLVAIFPGDTGQPALPPLAPRYLKDTSRLVCPADLREGEQGWALPCTYSYALQPLAYGTPEMKERVKTGLIAAYGRRLRLVLCPSPHRVGPDGFLTLRADGQIGKEVIGADDPQLKVKRSIWELGRRAHPGPRQSGGDPPAAHRAPKAVAPSRESLR